MCYLVICLRFKIISDKDGNYPHSLDADHLLTFQVCVFFIFVLYTFERMLEYCVVECFSLALILTALKKLIWSYHLACI